MYRSHPVRCLTVVSEHNYIGSFEREDGARFIALLPCLETSGYYMLMGRFEWAVSVGKDEFVAAPEFHLPGGVDRALFDQLHGGEITVDTQIGRRGRYETRVIYDFRLLEIHESRTWAEAQVTHQITQLAWRSAQRWICTSCGSSSWAAPGQGAECYTPDCGGDEMCGQCTPWRHCQAHQ